MLHAATATQTIDRAFTWSPPVGPGHLAHAHVVAPVTRAPALEHDLVAGLQAVLLPAAPLEDGRRIGFRLPFLDLAVLVLGVDPDQSVRVLEAELGHRAADRHDALLVVEEHREGMVREQWGRRRESQQRAQRHRRSLAHGCLLQNRRRTPAV
jgi:hypothetical protein